MPAHTSPLCVIRTTAVPERSADAAVFVAARSTAAVALSTPDPPNGPTVSDAARATTTATAPAIETCTRRRFRLVGATVTGLGAPMRALTASADATTVSAKPARERGFSLCSARRPCGVLI